MQIADQPPWSINPGIFLVASIVADYSRRNVLALPDVISTAGIRVENIDKIHSRLSVVRF